MPTGRPERHRGAQIYALDPKIEEIPVVSLAAPFSIASTRKVGPGSGVVVQQLGVKGMGLQPDFTGVLSLMTWGMADCFGAICAWDFSRHGPFGACSLRISRGCRGGMFIPLAVHRTNRSLSFSTMYRREKPPLSYRVLLKTKRLG